MGRIKDFYQEFLDKIGYKLGYDWEDAGSISISEINDLMDRYGRGWWVNDKP